MSIKKGDLVMVVKPTECCGSTKSLGHIFTVTSVRVVTSVCGVCGDSAADINCEDSDRTGCLPSRLKKIDPPSTGELDGVPVRKDVEAPIKGIPEEAVSK